MVSSFLTLGVINAQDGERDLSVREIVEILADMDVRHAAQQPFFPQAYGATDFSSDPNTIWIFTTGSTMTRRSTVIHELIHVRCYDAGVKCAEEYVVAEERRQYGKLFQ